MILLLSPNIPVPLHCCRGTLVVVFYSPRISTDLRLDNLMKLLLDVPKMEPDRSFDDCRNSFGVLSVRSSFDFYAMAV